MGEVLPLPTIGGVFLDAARPARALRVSWHADSGVVVLSVWDGPRCTGTVRVSVEDVPELIRSLSLQLGPQPGPPPIPQPGPQAGPQPGPQSGPPVGQPAAPQVGPQAVPEPGPS
jgi:hypothetical protein